MKNFKRTILLILFGISLNGLSIARSGCVADDPGECVAQCTSGTPCCVGYSPNCSVALDNNWINCGEGIMYCSSILE